MFNISNISMSNNAVLAASPFEQFQIGAILPSSGYINVFGNNYFILLFVMFSFLYFQYKANSTNLTVIPNKYHAILEGLYDFLYKMSVENIAKKGNDFFPLLFTLFTFILTCNMLGMIPLSLTITSQLFFVVSLALGLFIGINIIGFLRHGLHFFSLLMPQGVPLGMMPFLVLIELISYIFRVISLSARLFANMMSGHCLMYILSSFVVNMFFLYNALSFACVFPFIVVFCIVFLELGIACIQAYVFTVLIGLYLHDAISLH